MSGNRLFAKLALVIMPCFLVASFIGLFWLTEVDLRRKSDVLSTRIGNAAARVASGLERHVSDDRLSSHIASDSGHESLMQELMSMLLTDQAVICAELRDGMAGDVRLKAPRGLGCMGQTFDSSFDIPVLIDGEATLVVNFSTAEIEVARRSRREFSLLILCLGLLITTASSWLGFRLIIGRPLGQLLGAIQKSRDTGLPSPIETERQDELGVVMRAFNGMQDQLNKEAIAVRDACRRLGHVYNTTPALLCSCDEAGILTSVSDHWTSSLGLVREDVLGQPIETYLDGASAQSFNDNVLALISSRKSVRDIPLTLMALGSRQIDVLLSAVSDTDIDGRTMLLCVMSDITQLKSAEQRLRKLALTDALTGLPNRRGLVEHLGRVLHRNEERPESTSTAVLFIDLDSFKLINDTYGHEAGDRLLAEVGERLRLCVRVNDFIARLGGDEFAVVCHRLDNRSMVERVAERIIDELKKPFEHDEAQGFISASIGIAYVEPGMAGPDRVLQLADQAMYQAKQSGKGCHRTYSQELGNKAKSAAMLRKQVHHGLQDDGFSLVYQPIVNLTDEMPVGAEALLRLTCPRSGAIPPDAFVPVAEEAGLIHEVGEWVIANGMASVDQLDEKLVGNGFYVTLNLSSLQLNDQLIVQLEDVFERHPGARNRIVLEITETALLKRGDRVGELLSAARETGVRIALDDFGTGYSSLSHVHDYPVDILKIDRSFVQGLGTREADMTRRQMAMIGATSSLAKELGIVVVAEGIEAAISSRILLDCGITLGQGYLFSPPMPLGAFKDWCSEFGSSAPLATAQDSLSGQLAEAARANGGGGAPIGVRS